MIRISLTISLPLYKISWVILVNLFFFCIESIAVVGSNTTTIYFVLVQLFVQESKTENIIYKCTYSNCSCWFICLFSFTLGTFWLLNQPISKQLDNLTKFVYFTLNVVLLLFVLALLIIDKSKMEKISLVNTLSS